MNLNVAIIMATKTDAKNLQNFIISQLEAKNNLYLLRYRINLGNFDPQGNMVLLLLFLVSISILLCHKDHVRAGHISS